MIAIWISGKYIIIINIIVSLLLLYIYSNYISLPQLSYDLMLKQTGVTLELMTDIDQILFVEQNIRGGLSYIGQRFCKKTPENELLYIDGKYK